METNRQDQRCRHAKARQEPSQRIDSIQHGFPLILLCLLMKTEGIFRRKPMQQRHPWAQCNTFKPFMWSSVDRVHHTLCDPEDSLSQLWLPLLHAAQMMLHLKIPPSFACVLLALGELGSRLTFGNSSPMDSTQPCSEP